METNTYEVENFFTDYSIIHEKLISGEGGEKIFDQFPKKDIDVFNLE